MKRVLMGLIILLLAVMFIYPVVTTVLNSFKQENAFSIKGYLELFFDCFTFYPMFWNSVLYASVITILQLLIAIPCAFGFSYARFKGKELLYVFYIMLMMMPLQVTILPNYIGLRDLNLIDTRASIILPMIFSPFSVIVMHQYMKSIDSSLIEAIRLDTSSMIRIILSAVIPQLKVCLSAVALFVFAESWNLVEQPLLFIKSNNLKALTIMISESSKYSQAIIASASVIFMIPILLIYMHFNKYLEKGLTLKGL